MIAADQFAAAFDDFAGHEVVERNHAAADAVARFDHRDVVIGRGGTNIKEADAFKHVFGYTVINDVSAREVQRRHGQQWFKGKTLDGTCPMGPWIVTADEVPNPHGLRVV